MTSQTEGEYALAIDLGASSIGWVVMESMPDAVFGAQSRFRNAGVRIFEAGVEGQLESGKDESRGKKRREARSARRRLDRVSRRLGDLFRMLQRHSLLPQFPPEELRHAGDDAAPELSRRFARAGARDRLIAALDVQLVRKWQERLRAEGKTEAEMRSLPRKFFYVLRAKALDEKLDLHEVGRAIYHLAQRRGFLSNRLARGKDEKDEKEMGKVKERIGHLRKMMEEQGSRTLGEYLAGLDPDEERIRKRWTSRQMYQHEFDTIWAAQQAFYPDILTDELKAKISKRIFFQRPLRSQKHLIGECELEHGQKRAPMAIMAAQRFRMLQQVNHTRVITKDGEVRWFTPEERQALLNVLDVDGDLKFTKAKKLKALSNIDSFNFEEGGEEKFLGNRTAAKIAPVFGVRWNEFTDAEKDEIVNDLRSFEKEEPLVKRAKDHWKLSEEQARKFAGIKLEDMYCRLSRRALRKLLPLMEQGMAYMTAVTEVYGPKQAAEAMDSLPRIEQAMPELRNPVVFRALTELRKVVNGIVRQYGKPEVIRVELSRDLKRSRPERVAAWKKNRAIEKDRDNAAARITSEAGVQNPTRADEQKVLLAEECDWACPYTGKSITIQGLFGPEPQFDVEHIIPFSRCLDDSFMNKTLCDIEENRNVKRNRSPWEAYGSNPEKWEQIMQRVKRFRGDGRLPKLERFALREEELEKILEDFATRQLNDTRYASRLAVKYLELLYGPEAQKRKIVQVGRGQITAYLRSELGLNAILGDGDRKSRDDHRHHAVDAIAIVLTDPATVKMMSDAAAGAMSARRRRFAPIPPPWERFLNDAHLAIEAINVSHRVSRKVNGPLHEETFYAPIRSCGDGSEIGCYHKRKPLSSLSEGEVENIVDPVVRATVKAKLEQTGKKAPKDAFADETNLPCLQAKDGRRIPIRKVRVKTSVNAFSIGKGPGQRHVVTDTNHHMEIIETKDKKGNVKWEGRVVSRYEAMRRLRAHEPIVKRDHGPEKRFVFSLACGEMFEIENEELAVRDRFVVRGISQYAAGQCVISHVRPEDARKVPDMRKTGDYRRITPNELRKADCRKVTMTPLGEVRNAKD